MVAKVNRVKKDVRGVCVISSAAGRPDTHTHTHKKQTIKADLHNIIYILYVY